MATQKHKKSGNSWTIELNETPDVLAKLAARKNGQIVVGFAAESENTLKNAADKLRRKKLDLIVANDVTAEGAGFEVDTNVVTLLWPDGRTEPLPCLPKSQVAGYILDAIIQLKSC